MMDPKHFVSMEEAGGDFSRVARMVDRDGLAVILESGQPKYAVMEFAEYEAARAAVQMRREVLAHTADLILTENMETFEELAK